MTVNERIETALRDALAATRSETAPPLLAKAIDYSVFPGGARMRPRLCLAVSEACGGRDRAASFGAAAAIEMMHCASLVHDDLPCFDDAQTRRGKPSVHRAFGEPIAVLAGDALIVMAFETIVRGAVRSPAILPRLVSTLSRAVGTPFGIIAGQAWESEPAIDLAVYQRAKTGALFRAAVEAGALTAGHDPGAWSPVGDKLGEAYQVADDLHDAMSTAEEMGKPSGQDALHGRPNAVDEHGVSQSLARLKSLLGDAVSAIPECAGRNELKSMIEAETSRFIPRRLAACAA